jgi:threonyl-tRNA synthetase
MSAPTQPSAARTTEIPADAPEYIAHRLAVWDAAVELRASGAAPDPTAAAAAAAVPMAISLPDGSVKEGIAGVTTPMNVAMQISETLGRKSLVALVDGVQWDMERPMAGDCQLKICGWDTAEGKSVLWHSTAHMLGEAMECKYKGELCIGPPLEDGFYYDIHMPGDEKVTDADFDDLNTRVDKIAKSKRTFQRLELTKDEARDMFSYNPFKLEIIAELDDSATITAYRDGPFIDLCRGPHIPQSTRVKAMMCKGTGQAYWRAKADNPSLQRVYGISFPDKKLLMEYKTLMEEAAKRDHRVLGPKPYGQRIFNTLSSFLKDEYWKRGYQEVQTPNMFDFDLWNTSGHAANYKDNMFQLEVEGREFGLKPMNCPSHCLIFASRVRSHRELPMRIADFGVLHRNELSGSLGGLTRVRRFQQDDAHIFCLADQVRKEVFDFLQFLKYTYDIFGFEYELDLSTRPEKFLGEIEQWDVAEQMLSDALIEFTGKQCGEKGGWELNPGDGAFYGPKVDIKVFDALKRRHQCATLQLDFQLPVRFNLQVQSRAPALDKDEISAQRAAAKAAKAAAKTEAAAVAKAAKAARITRASGIDPNAFDIAPVLTECVSDSTQRCNGDEMAGAEGQAAARADEDEEDVNRLRNGFERPVIIHRAIYGSFERFIAILIEHYGGFWPFWLSPRQAIVVPVSEKFMDYAKDIVSGLRAEKFHVDIDTSDRTMGKKMAEARNQYYNNIIVVGEQEVADQTVTIRLRGSEETRELPLADVVAEFAEQRKFFK